ncbi:MAG: nucleotidyltransferase domain-containing protein [Aggregatilineales bacterium]
MNNPEIRALLDLILSRMQDVLGKRLVGLYVYGSLVTGDFDSETSDIDLLSATSSDIDQVEFDALKAMHEATTLDHRKWDGRLEIAYVSLHALKTFKTERSKIGIISPGEPFHIKIDRFAWIRTNLKNPNG